MPKERLNVVVTRRLPAAVETRLKELFNVTLRDDDTPMTRQELVDAVRSADVLIPCITDKIDAGLIGQAGERLKLIANFGAGIDHVDVFENVENVAPETAEVSEVSGRRPSAGRRRRLSPARFAVARTDDDAYVNPRLLRLAARGRGRGRLARVARLGRRFRLVAPSRRRARDSRRRVLALERSRAFVS